MRNYKEEAKRLKKELGRHGGLSFFRAIGYGVEKVTGGWILKNKENIYNGHKKINTRMITSKRLISKLEMFEYIVKDGFDTTDIYDRTQPTERCLDPQEWNYKNANKSYMEEINVNFDL